MTKIRTPLHTVIDALETHDLRKWDWVSGKDHQFSYLQCPCGTRIYEDSDFAKFKHIATNVFNVMEHNLQLRYDAGFVAGKEVAANYASKEGARQMLLLGLAELSLRRPGWEWALRNLAKMFYGEQMFDGFRETSGDIIKPESLVMGKI